MSQKVITRVELKKHNKKTDVWIAIKGNVYHVTAFSSEHPGGDILLVRLLQKIIHG